MTEAMAPPRPECGVSLITTERRLAPRGRLASVSQAKESCTRLWPTPCTSDMSGGGGGRLGGAGGGKVDLDLSQVEIPSRTRQDQRNMAAGHATAVMHKWADCCRRRVVGAQLGRRSNLARIAAHPKLVVAEPRLTTIHAVVESHLPNGRDTVGELEREPLVVATRRVAHVAHVVVDALRRRPDLMHRDELRRSDRRRPGWRRRRAWWQRRRCWVGRCARELIRIVIDVPANPSATAGEAVPCTFLVRSGLICKETATSGGFAIGDAGFEAARVGVPHVASVTSALAAQAPCLRQQRRRRTRRRWWRRKRW